MNPVEEFKGGVDKFREKLNRLVRKVNDYESRIEAIEKWPEQVVVIHNADNTRLYKARIKLCELIEDLGVIDCDCVSGGEVGDA